MKLPSPAELERTCRGLATLDAMLSADWGSRYYSFDERWDAKRRERMASMRNGSGDDWFIVFAHEGVFLKAFWHEYEREDASAIYDGIPDKLVRHVTEPAFMTNDITFGGWHDGRAWTLRGNAKPMAGELAMLQGNARTYCAYAAHYFGVTVPGDAVTHVLAGKPLDAKLVARITTARTLDDLGVDLSEIGYGT